MKRGARLAQRVALIALIDLMLSANCASGAIATLEGDVLRLTALARQPGEAKTKRAASPEAASVPIALHGGGGSNATAANLQAISEPAARSSGKSRARDKKQQLPGAWLGRQSRSTGAEEQVDDQVAENGSMRAESVAQARRAARNVKRKMELLSGRVDQIQSLIAEDHRPQAGASSSTAISDSYSAPYNGDLAAGDLLAGPAAVFGDGSNQSLWTSQAPGREASEGRPPPAAGAPEQVSLEPSSAASNNDERWSAPLTDDERESSRVSERPKSLESNETQSSAIKWSAPIIKSVVPTQARTTASTPTDESATDGGDMSRQRDASEAGELQQQMGAPTAAEQQGDEQQQQQESEPSSQGKQATRNSLQETTSTAPLAQAQFESGALVAESSQGVVAQQHDLNATQGRYTSGPLDTQASMLGPEWSQHQNYQFFNELNTKNHAKGQSETQAERRAQSADSAGVAFKAAPAVGQQSAHVDSLDKARKRFQNMTILSSENDLLNSFSNKQQQLQHQQPGGGANSPPSSPTGLARKSVTGGQQAQAGANGGARKSSVLTYSAGNYGKSSKDQMRAAASQAISVPTEVSSFERASSEASYSDYAAPRPAAGGQSQRQAMETRSANGTGSSQALRYSQLNDARRPIQWPSLASRSSYAPQPPVPPPSSTGHEPPNLYEFANQRYSSPITLPVAGHSTDSAALGSQMADTNSIQDETTTPPLVAGAQMAHKYSNLVHQPGSPGHLDSGGSDSANSEVNLAKQAGAYSPGRGQGTKEGPQHQRSVYTSTGRETGYPAAGSYLRSAPNQMDPFEQQLAASNSSVDNLKHRSSSSQSEEPGLGYSALSGQSDSYASGSTAADSQLPAQQPQGAGLDSTSATSSGGYSNGQTVSADPSSQLEPTGGATGSSGTQLDRNLYTLAQELGSGSSALESALAYAGFTNQVGSSALGANSRQQPQQSQAESAAADSQSPDYAAIGARSNLFTPPEGGEPSGGVSESSGGYERELAYAPRNSPAAYYQGGGQQQQLQDSMQPAATSTSNHLLRQHQLGQLAAAIVAQNPSLSSQDMSAFLQRYQSQQRLLNSQVQRQQQQLESQLASSSYAPAYARDSAASSVQAQPQQQSNIIFRRYSPESAYLGATVSRGQLTGGSGQQFGTAEPSELLSYQQTNPPAGHYQPLYTASSLESPRALRAANLAYYRAALAAAAKSNQQQQHQLADAQSAGSSYLANLAALQQQQQQQQQQQSMAASSSGGSNFNNAGALYATAAMNSPAVYEAPGQAKSADAGVQSPGASSSPGATLASILDTTNNQRQQQQQQQYSGGGSYKRGYLNSLFKPTASSRYYYTPNILSPISLASPTMLHSIYAPSLAAPAAPSSAPAEGSLASLPQMYAANAYAAANPYAAMQHSAALTAASQLDQQAAAAQQYQAFAAAAAAAAAAGGLQPHYLDPDMAESSLVASDGVASAFADPATAASQSLAAFSSSQGASASSSGSSSAGQDDSSSSSSSSKKGMGPWSNIAGLLLGILPFGILMASLLPAVNVAGRKKRELELSGRNFSELLKWRAPSKVLSALIGAGGESGLSKATAIINEQLSSFVHRGNTGADQAQQSNSPSSMQQLDDSGQYSKRRSLAVRTNPLKSPTAWDKLAPSASMNGREQLVYSVAPPSVEANSTSTTLSQPMPSTTPMPHMQASQSANSSSGGGVKAKVRKAISALNNFIVTAQNIRRKHRSSIVDSQWSLPSMLRSSSLKLENLFNVNEFRRQMASIAHTRERLTAAAAPLLLLHHRPTAPANRATTATATQSSAPGNNETEAAEGLESPPRTTSDRQGELNGEPPGGASVTGSLAAKGRNEPGEREPPGGVEIKQFDNSLITNNHSPSRLPGARAVAGSETNQVRSGGEPMKKPALFVSSVGGDEAQSANEVTSNLAPQRTDEPSREQPRTSTRLPLASKVAELSNSTRHHLESCLNYFLCNLIVRVNQSLKSPTASSSNSSLALKGTDQTPGGAASGQINRLKNSAALTPEQMERITKTYINQLIEQIEAENPTVRLKRPRSVTRDEASGLAAEAASGQQESALDTMYKNAMRSKCNVIYRCLELDQLQRTLNKMKLRYN